MIQSQLTDTELDLLLDRILFYDRHFRLIGGRVPQPNAFFVEASTLLWAGHFPMIPEIET